MKLVTHDLELEAVIDVLTETHNIQIGEIADKLGMARYLFNNHRRSTKVYRRKELMKTLMAAYPEYFPDGKVAVLESKGAGASYPDLLIASMERENANLKEEVAELREMLKENNRLMHELLKKL